MENRTFPLHTYFLGVFLLQSTCIYLHSDSGDWKYLIYLRLNDKSFSNIEKKKVYWNNNFDWHALSLKEKQTFIDVSTIFF